MTEVIYTGAFTYHPYFLLISEKTIIGEFAGPIYSIFASPPETSYSPKFIANAIPQHIRNIAAARTKFFSFRPALRDNPR